MAHAAEIDPTTGTVVRVIVVSNDCEPKVEEWCAFQYGGVWKQTSYNHKFRKNFAGVGFSYDQEMDAFIPPQPHHSWTLDHATAQWKPPVARPEGQNVEWDEVTQSWRPPV